MTILSGEILRCAQNDNNPDFVILIPVGVKNLGLKGKFFLLPGRDPSAAMQPQDDNIIG
jgi:hypothetical protein